MENALESRYIYPCFYIVSFEVFPISIMCLAASFDSRYIFDQFDLFAAHASMSDSLFHHYFVVYVITLMVSNIE